MVPIAEDVELPGTETVITFCVVNVDVQSLPM